MDNHDDKDKKHNVSVVICGHVDAGKSTTTGRLIYELGGLTEREFRRLQDEADRLGKGTFAYAFLMDTLAEERARGITIQCQTREFHTERFNYTIIDAPGHRDFVKNMISGASQADVALLLVPADGNFATSIAKGNHKAGEVKGQTREHARLINLLGIKQLIVGINKMDTDTAHYSEERYEEVRNEVKDMLLKVGWPRLFVEHAVAYIPMSGFQGDNLSKLSENMPWWKGITVTNPRTKDKVTVCTLYEALDKMVQPPARNNDKPLRFPVSQVLKIPGVGDVLTGRVEQGMLRPGDEVKFVPTHTDGVPCTGKVLGLEMHHKSVPFAGAGDNVGVNLRGLNKANMPVVGDIMVPKADASLHRVARFVAQVQVLEHPGELKVGYSPIVFCRTARSACRMTALHWRQGKETGGERVENPAYLRAGDLAEVEFTPSQLFCVEAFDACEGLGRIAVLEGNTAIFLGKVLRVE